MAKFSRRKRHREFEKEKANCRVSRANDFQDPYASLDGRMKVRDIIAEGIDIRGLAKTAEERDAMVENCLKQ